MESLTSFKPLEVPKKNRDGYLEDLNKLSKCELLDLMDRQKKIISRP